MVNLVPIPDEAKLAQFDAVFYEMIGGIEVARMLYRYHVDGLSYPELSKDFGIPMRTIQDRCKAAREKIRRCGVWPTQWIEKTRRVPEKSALVSPSVN